MNSLIGLKNSVMPSLAVPHAPAQNANPAPGKSSAGFTHGWFFSNKNDWRISTAGSFIDEKLGESSFANKTKVWDV